MKIAKDKLLEELNKGRYWSGNSRRPCSTSSTLPPSPSDSEGIQKELIIHSQEEMAHAVLLSDQIDFLGGTPTVDVEKREISKDSLKMLKQDLAGEDNAIKRYHERIEQAESLKLYGLRRVLEDIPLQEEEHKRDLAMAIEG